MVQRTVLRRMQPGDLPAVMAIQREAYGDAYQESMQVLGDKLALAPQGCWLAECNGVAVAYVLSHPWHSVAPPPLHAPLHEVPSVPQCLFLHDLAVVPAARSGGVAARLLERVTDWAVTQRVSRIALVALASAAGFWGRQGFVPVTHSSVMPDSLSGYGAGALLMQRQV